MGMIVWGVNAAPSLTYCPAVRLPAHLMSHAMGVIALPAAQPQNSDGAGVAVRPGVATLFKMALVIGAQAYRTEVANA